MAPRIRLLRLSLLRSLVPSSRFCRPNPTPLSQKTSPPEPLFPYLFRYSAPIRPFAAARAFSSSAGSSNVVTIGSEQGFHDSFQKVQDEGLNAIFYFTATWCAPCRVISPVIEELSGKFPNVSIYKVDIDLPTLHFFKNGKKVAEMVGADAAGLKDTMENLYEQ